MTASKTMIAVLLVLFIPYCISGQNDTHDEGRLKRFEIGGKFVFLRRVNADPGLEVILQNEPIRPKVDPAKQSEFALGGRFTFNITNNIAIEAEANVFPVDKRRTDEIGVPIRIFEPGGRKFQALFGSKIGIRKDKFGVFGKVRPGFISFDRYEAIDEIITDGKGLLIFSSTRHGVKFFNIDVGGVLEFYPSKNTIIRSDIGDTIIHYRKLPPREINPSFTRHNLQTSIGFGFRF